MPVLRNPQFYFKEGFCWTNVLNPHAKDIKCKLKGKTINDVGSMSLYSLLNYYLICLLNSRLIFNYYRTFINNTVNIQINDIRQIPIVIPNKEQIKCFNKIFDNAIKIKKMEYSKSISLEYSEKELNILQKQLDLDVNKLYSI